MQIRKIDGAKIRYALFNKKTGGLLDGVRKFDKRDEAEKAQYCLQLALDLEIDIREVV